jgi:hypothetical protein
MNVAINPAQLFLLHQHCSETGSDDLDIIHPVIRRSPSGSSSISELVLINLPI